MTAESRRLRSISGYGGRASRSFVPGVPLGQQGGAERGASQRVRIGGPDRGGGRIRITRLAGPVLALVSTGCAGRLEAPELIAVDPSPAPFTLEPPARSAEPPARPPPPDAEAFRDLTVERAVLLALENDRDLLVQTLSPVVAGTFEAQERGVFDPELFVEASYFRERASQTARATGERFDVTGESTDEQLGLRQRLPTGTTLELLLRHRLDDSDRTPAQNEARVGLTVTQSLLRDLGPAVNLAALRQAEVGVEASLYELRAFAASVVANAEIAYWTYALGTEEVRVFERALEVAEREAKDIEDRVEVGLLPEMERAAPRAEVALRRQALVDARARREDARLRLVRRIGAHGRLDVPVRATTALAARPASPLDDVNLRVELAVRRRPELGQARAQVQQGRLRTVITENGMLPRLDVFVRLGKTGFDQTFGRAFERLDGPTYDVQAGLSLGYFLGHRAAAAEDRSARASKRQAELAVENLERMVRLEVRLAANELDRALAQIDATAATRRARETAVEAERARLEVGAGTALLLARADRDLVESQIAELRAAVDYRIARVRLYLAEGTLLARRGVTIAGSDA